MLEVNIIAAFLTKLLGFKGLFATKLRSRLTAYRESRIYLKLGAASAGFFIALSWGSSLKTARKATFHRLHLFRCHSGLTLQALPETCRRRYLQSSLMTGRQVYLIMPA